MLEDLQEGVHHRLTEELTRRGRSVNWLAQEIGVPQRTLAGQFQRRSFSLETVVGAADALRLDLHWLIRGHTRSEYDRQVEALLDEMVAKLARDLKNLMIQRPRGDTGVVPKGPPH